MIKVSLNKKPKHISQAGFGKSALETHVGQVEKLKLSEEEFGYI